MRYRPIAVVLLVALFLSDCTMEKNAAACASYEAAYAVLSDTVSRGGSPDETWTAMESMSALITAAAEQGDGTIQGLMLASALAASRVNRGDNGDASLQFFEITQAVQEACAEAGYIIELGDLG